jgi:hypothetical protein
MPNPIVTENQAQAHRTGSFRILRPTKRSKDAKLQALTANILKQMIQ